MLMFPRFAAVVAERDLAYQDLAAVVGVTPTYISLVIRGRMKPSEGFKARCATALGLPADELFQLSPQMEQLVKLARLRGLVDDPFVLNRAVEASS